ncbi:MAG: L-tyrosine/L-tryptophan isonitrile synthase family protein [Micromonosporaceae bacterium]
MRRVVPAAPDRAAGDGTLSHAPSLGVLDLAAMRPFTEKAPRRVDLDDAAAHRLVSALTASSDRAVGDLVAELGHRVDTSPTAVLHHLLTHKRFRRGPRRNFPLPVLHDRIRRYVDAGEPVPVAMQGFPFKQCDNGLKAAGPLPDIADLGAMLRLVELQRAFTAYYPPGLNFLVMYDGGYHRPRPRADLDHYRAALRELEELAGLAGALVWRDKHDVVADSLGAAATRRAEWIGRYQELIDRLVQPAAATHDSYAAEALIAFELPPRVPRFGALYRSLVYSVPVPSPTGVPSPEWSRQVLAELFHVDDPAAPAALRLARRAVLRRAWDDTVRYVAVAAADQRCQVDQSLPPHLRLRSGITGQGEIGLTYLGGSALLPWHGTGCVDRRAQVAVDFRVALHDRGLVPVHCPVIGADQPFLMVPPEFVASDAALAPELLRRIRLRRR